MDATNMNKTTIANVTIADIDSCEHGHYDREMNFETNQANDTKQVD
jgi:hypothetical protein